MNIFLVLKILIKNNIIGNKKENFMIDDEKLKEQKELIKWVESGQIKKDLNISDEECYKSLEEKLKEAKTKEEKNDILFLMELDKNLDEIIEYISNLKKKDIGEVDISETSFDYA